MKLRSLFLIGVVFIIVLLQGCTQPETCENPSDYTIKDGNLLLDKEGTIPCTLCEERNLDKTIVVLESKYCGACQAVIPTIQEVAKELGATITFLDLSEKIDMDRMNQMKVMPYYTPTMLVGCDVYVGGKTKAEYKSIFNKFLKK